MAQRSNLMVQYTVCAGCDTSCRLPREFLNEGTPTKMAAAPGIKVLDKTSSLASMKCGDANTQPIRRAGLTSSHKTSTARDERREVERFVANDQLKKGVGRRRGSRTVVLCDSISI